MSYFLAYCKSHRGTVFTQYQMLRAERQLCDVSLIVDGNEFPAHKSLLACSSDYFRAMFKDHTKESKATIVHLKVISATGLQNILDFIYTSWLSLSLSTLEDTLEAASYLQVLGAIPLCSQFLINTCDLESCCFVVNIAFKFYLTDALTEAEKYIITNLWRLLQEDLDDTELLELNVKSMINIIKSNDIPRVSEKSLLTLVLNWLQYDRIRLGYAKVLFDNIRYGLLPLDTLRKLYTQTDVPLTASIKCMIIKAINYHSTPSKQPLLQDKFSTLRNQKEWIMLVGGTANDTFVENVLGFDVYSHKWRSVTNLHLKVQHHCTCVIGNFLYVLGGETPERAQYSTKDSSLCVTNIVYRYDPRFDQWLQVSGMLENRAQFSCCIIDKYIFAMGGRGDQQTLLSTVEVYDINRDTWTKCKDLPSKMHGHAGTVHSNIIYISGGKTDTQANSSKDVYSFNRLEGQWKKQASMSIARFGHQMATVKDAIFTFLGIYEPFSDIEKYDPKTNQWTRLRPLPFDRFSYGLVVVEQTVLLLGGKKWQDSQEVPTQNIVGYDTENDCWEEICSMAFPFSGLQCSVLQLSDVTESDEKCSKVHALKKVQ
ncbi:kelch-like protein 34 [Xenopus tropicalis]|uniref:Kelch-like family member 34 n=1 Tax=Xenopus tropicalis TaxID=8364 RepID=F6ZM37_XENTR|nr:kelch-like protein 34 [Xenopus tropicalis]